MFTYCLVVYFFRTDIRNKLHTNNNKWQLPIRKGPIIAIAVVVSIYSLYLIRQRRKFVSIVKYYILYIYIYKQQYRSS